MEERQPAENAIPHNSPDFQPQRFKQDHQLSGNQVTLSLGEPDSVGGDWTCMCRCVWIRVDVYIYILCICSFNYLIIDIFIVLLVLVEMQNATQRCVHLMSKCRCSYSFRWLVLKARSKPMSLSEVETNSIYKHRMLCLPEKCNGAYAHCKPNVSNNMETKVRKFWGTADSQLALGSHRDLLFWTGFRRRSCAAGRAKGMSWNLRKHSGMQLWQGRQPWINNLSCSRKYATPTEVMLYICWYSICLNVGLCVCVSTISLYFSWIATGREGVHFRLTDVNHDMANPWGYLQLSWCYFATTIFFWV